MWTRAASAPRSTAIPVTVAAALGDHQSGRLIVFVDRIDPKAKPSDAVDFDPFRPTGATIAAQQADDRCRPVTVDGADLVRCTGLRSDPDLSLTLTSTRAVSHAVTVTALPADPYDDPEPDPTPDADTVTVAPGTTAPMNRFSGSSSDGSWTARLSGREDQTRRAPVSRWDRRAGSSPVSATRPAMSASLTFRF